MASSLTTAEPTSDQPTDRRRIAPDANKLSTDDHAAHDWYRFVLSYPPHLVRDYLKRLPAPEGRRVLDPFCGTGTTIVECKKLGIEVYRQFGIELKEASVRKRSAKYL